MKSIITVLAITFSLNSFASQITFIPTLGTSVLTHMSSGGKAWKEAKIIEAANEFHQTGKLSGELESLVNDIKDAYEVSDAEAVDMALDMIGA